MFNYYACKKLATEELTKSYNIVKKREMEAQSKGK